MYKYFFVLGRNHILSLAEIISILKKNYTTFTLQEFSPEVLLVALDMKLDNVQLMKVLGGTIKIGQILDELSLDVNDNSFFQIFKAKNLINKYISPQKGKIHLGISLYDALTNKKYLEYLSKELLDIYKLIKHNLKQENLRVGFVRLKDRYLSSVSVSKNKLLTSGVEIVIILTPTKIMVGKTLSIQEYEQFSLRDAGRPFLDKKSGIMPTKLARIMINLGRSSITSKILDPFCGSGTILQEAILLGYKEIIGSDISEQAIVNSRKNIDWLFNFFTKTNKSLHNIKLMVTDVKNLSTQLPDNSIDLIVTEPYLGPPLYKSLYEEEIIRLLGQLNHLYLQAFRQFAKIVRTKGIIVIVFPIFIYRMKTYLISIIESLEKLGFAKVDFFSDIPNKSLLKLTPRQTIIYGSDDQFVKREILSFIKIR